MRHRLRLIPALIWVCVVLDGCGGDSVTDLSNATLGVPEVVRIMEATTGYTNILPAEVKEKLDAKEDFTILDVRTPTQYRSGHLPTAISMPVATLPWAMNTLNRSKEVVVYCQTGLTSVSSSAVLVSGGFSNVKNMVGGISAWPYEVVTADTVVISL
ncbi:rhodanese-like domain-containing protein [Candidatus Hydrogenedentota bacterium]